MQGTARPGFFQQHALFVYAILLCAILWPLGASAASAAKIAKDATQALEQLQTDVPSTQTLAAQATAVLMFPQIVKAGMVVGGQYGSGALLRNGKVHAYYNIAAASFGLQAGIQAFGYALFFMNEEALQYLDRSEGWAMGVGPSVVILDQAFAKSVTTTTLTQDVYAVPFGAKGLMAGVGLEGSKITRIHPD